jgi:predicted dehydrogenase/threonine dehydrogenase-like Zn-dependent dehydrogenase
MVCYHACTKSILSTYMKQVSQSYRNGDVTLAEVPPPSLKAGGILVRNAVSLISPGTERLMLEMSRKSLIGKAKERPDLVRQVMSKARREGIGPTVQAVLSRLDAPVPLGYSAAGVVMAVAEGVDEFQPGDAVACAGAGYAVHAEIISVPHNLCVKLPSAPLPEMAGRLENDDVSFEAAAFTTVGAIALQGVRIADVRLGEVVVVIGLGLIGLLTVQLLKAAGCRVLGLDLNPARCQLASTLGCDVATTDHRRFTERTLSCTEGHGADAVIITAGTKSNAPIELAAELCREKGRAVAVGAVNMDVPRRPFYEKELELRLSRSYGPGRYDPLYEERGIDYPYGYVRWTERRNMAAFLDLVAHGKVHTRPLVTHRFPIERALEAYALITQEKVGEAVGVLLTYGSSAPTGQKEPTAPALLRIAPAATGRPRQTSKAIRVGMIGAGAFAKSVLLPRLKAIPGVELATICTATGLSARHTAEKFGFATCTTDADAVFSDAAIDAVVIATRHNLHAPLVLRALETDKHVFVEKPLALHEGELRSLVQSFRIPRSNVLMVGFNRRFAPLTLQVKQFFSPRAGPLAITYRVNAGQVPSEHWVHDAEEGGGRIVGEVCHFVDWMCAVTGALPVKVYAQALPTDGRYAPEDNALITLTFADGSVGTIHYLANGDASVPKERIEIFGNATVATIEDFQTGSVVRQGRHSRLSSRLRPRQDKGHGAELRAFTRAIREGDPSPTPLDEAALVTLTTFKIRQSLRDNTPVDVEPYEALEASAVSTPA